MTQTAMKSKRLKTCPDEIRMAVLTPNTLFAPGMRSHLRSSLVRAILFCGQLDLATILWQVAGFKIAEDAVCVSQLSGENGIVKVEFVTTWATHVLATRHFLNGALAFVAAGDSRVSCELLK